MEIKDKEVEEIDKLFEKVTQQLIKQEEIKASPKLRVVKRNKK